jgi:hypothetical protein
MSTVNGGIVIRLLPRTVFNVPASINTTITFPICAHVDAAAFQEADMIVRFHSGTSLPGAGQSATVNALADGYDFADPATPFFTASVANGAITNASTIPLYTVVNIPQPFGRMLAFNLAVLQTAAGGAIAVALSLDLNLKAGDPAGMQMAPNGYRGYRTM